MTAPDDGSTAPQMELGHFLAARVVPGFVAALLVGLAAGAARILGGAFAIGIQGMMVGALIGWISGRGMRRDTFAESPLGLRLAWAFGLTGVFWVGQMLGADVALGTFTPGTWVLHALDDGEVMLGHRRYSFTAHVLHPGPVAWVGFNVLDAVLQALLTLVTLTTSLRTEQEPGHVPRRSPAGAAVWLLLLPTLLTAAYAGAAVLARPREPVVDLLRPPPGTPPAKPMTPTEIQQMEDQTQRLQSESEACDKLAEPLDRIHCRDALLQKMNAPAEPASPRP